MIGSCPLDGPGKGLEKAGDILYVATRGKGVVLLDVSAPTAPKKLKTLSDTHRVRSLEAHGDRLYLGAHTAASGIYDISDPGSPKRLSAFNKGGEAYGISGNDKLLAVGDLQRGLQLFDVSNPSSPRKIAVAEQYGCHGAIFDGNHIYIAAESPGFVILEYSKSEARVP